MKKISFGFCLMVLIIELLVIWGVQALWNWLAPMFWVDAPILTYWQTAGCMLLLQFIAGLFKR